MVSETKKIVETQLNRSLRSDVEVVSRCHFNLPAVIKVPSNLDDGTPFPTSYWLTCPMYIKKVGSLESQGLIKELDKQLDQNKDLYKKWSDRQKSYEDERNKDNKNNQYRDNNMSKCFYEKCQQCLLLFETSSVDVWMS